MLLQPYRTFQTFDSSDQVVVIEDDSTHFTRVDATVDFEPGENSILSDLMALGTV